MARRCKLTRRTAHLATALIAAALLGCRVAPTRAIPGERAVFDGRGYLAGRAEHEGRRRSEVVEIRRVGLREDESIFLLVRDGKLDVEVVEAGTTIAREPRLHELEEAAALLSPRNPAWKRGLARWLGARVDLTGLVRALGTEIDARGSSGTGFIGDLAEAYRDEREVAELRDREARRRDPVFAGLLGWERGRYAGYSWSIPFHVERYDRTQDLREVAILPLLAGARFEQGGAEVLFVPLLTYAGCIETPVSRTGGLAILGLGRRVRESSAGTVDTVFFLPALGLRRVSTGEDFPSTGGRVRPGERRETHILASLVAFSSERPGIYRDASGRTRTTGSTRSSWRVLPFASHREDARSSETMIWPLLGLGWGRDKEGAYVRLFYFLRW